MLKQVQRWGIWALAIALAVLLLVQRQEIARLQQSQRLYAERFSSLFPYMVRRADFHSLPATLEQLAEAQELEPTIRLFKQVQTLAVAFTDDLLMLNDVRYSGVPQPGMGVQYGNYRYMPSTPEQEALQWKILRARPYTTLWAMERKFYLDEGAMQPAEREALRALAQHVRAVAERVDGLRQTMDAVGEPGIAAAARSMEELGPLLDALEQVASAYEATLPPLQFKPGGLYDRLYGTRPSGG